MELPERMRITRKIESDEDMFEDIFDVLEIIRERPQLYFGEKSVTELGRFLSAYQFAMARTTGVICSFDHLFQLFTEYKYREVFPKNHWDKMLKYHNVRDDIGFDIFFVFLDEFKKLYRSGELENVLKRWDSEKHKALIQK